MMDGYQNKFPYTAARSIKTQLGGKARFYREKNEQKQRDIERHRERERHRDIERERKHGTDAETRSDIKVLREMRCRKSSERGEKYKGFWVRVLMMQILPDCTKKQPC